MLNYTPLRIVLRDDSARHVLKSYATLVAPSKLSHETIRASRERRSQCGTQVVPLSQSYPVLLSRAPLRHYRYRTIVSRAFTVLSSRAPFLSRAPSSSTHCHCIIVCFLYIISSCGSVRLCPRGGRGGEGSRAGRQTPARCS